MAEFQALTRDGRIAEFTIAAMDYLKDNFTGEELRKAEKALLLYIDTTNNEDGDYWAALTDGIYQAVDDWQGMVSWFDEPYTSLDLADYVHSEN
jgi:hypothetical protein